MLGEVTANDGDSGSGHEPCSAKDIPVFPAPRNRHGEGTQKALPDVPSASLYRHVRILADHAILAVAGENRIRGTVESVYRLNKDAMAAEDADGSAVQMSLLGICASFARYFAGGSADPRRDMLLLTNCTLVLTDEEFSAFLADINEVALKYMKIEAAENRRTRRITLISAPADEQTAEMKGEHAYETDGL